MDLTFTQEGNAYVATFEAKSDFNLHIEQQESDLVQVLQRTAPDGKFAIVNEMSTNAFGKVIDLDFAGVIYPKTIKVVMQTMPTYAVVTGVD